MPFLAVRCFLNVIYFFDSIPISCRYIFSIKLTRTWGIVVLCLSFINDVRLLKVAANGRRLGAGGELEFLLPGTVAKFITKSSLLLLPLNKVFSAGTAAERYTTAHC